MTLEMKFFIFLLEHYAAYKGEPPAQVLEQWDRLGLTGLIYGMYEMYHTEALENAYQDIDELTAETLAR